MENKMGREGNDFVDPGFLSRNLIFVCGFNLCKYRSWGSVTIS